MEILIQIPAPLQNWIEWILTIVFHVRGGYQHVATMVRQIIFHHHDDDDAHHGGWYAKFPPFLVPLLVVSIFFWPILLSLFMSLAAAWAWIFWLVTSVLLGLLQVLYATYQFVMIGVDIFALSLLKTYTMIKYYILVGLFKFSKHHNKEPSRAKFWRTQLDQCVTYEDFLKLRIRPKEDELNFDPIDSALPRGGGRSDENDEDANDDDVVTTTTSPTGGANNRRHNPAIWPLLHRRSNSAADLRRAAAAVETNDGTTARTHTHTTMYHRKIPRVRSFPSAPEQERRHDADQDDDHRHSTFPLRHDPAVLREMGQTAADLLVTTTRQLERARADNGGNSTSQLKFLLTAVVKRNHLNIDEYLVENSRGIAATGQYGLSTSTRQYVRQYLEQVEKSLDWLAEQQQAQQPHDERGGISGGKSDGGAIMHNNNNLDHDLADRYKLVRKMKQNMGRTALMLSGGGAQAMYHLGVIKALIESRQYQDITVISGTSGGSISAAMCAIKTADELWSDVCVTSVSTDFGPVRGEQAKRNIRWFPTMWDMATYWFKHKLLVDSETFQKTCEFYYGNVTFEEAFNKTGKNVCITVSASRANGNTAQRLLLNHISTPHVTIASAVRASCGLPGVMAPAKLIVKNGQGELEPFEVDGVEWIDGSVQADLPFQRISTLFAVTNFIVSQTNFHVVPFLNKAHHPNHKSLYWRLFQTIEWDIRSRALKLSRLGLFPKVFGQDISKVFKQKYYGNLTIVPRFTTMQTFGLQALSNPTVKDMEGYLKHGQLATWPYLNAIRDTLRLEKALDQCLTRLEGQMRATNPDFDWSTNDDVDSIASSSMVSSSRVRIIGRPFYRSGSISEPPGTSNVLRHRVSGLERENQQLREELRRLRELVVVDATASTSPPEEDGFTSISPDTDVSAGMMTTGSLSVAGY